MPNGKMRLGKSAALQAVWRTAKRAASTNCTVLITGESGTGKELLAWEIHAHSRRHEGPFVPVNCGALSESLLESELFGHVKGAFTGANTRHPGLFEQARGGTLFLDEIGEVSPALQVKLLRVLQERKVRLVGDTKDIDIDVRILAATNADIEQLMSEGGFRDDLFYRLNVVPLHLPPLRERPEDIPDLANFFRESANKEHGRAITRLTDDAMRLLQEYSWPGNIRELRNIVERMVVLSEGSEITREDVPSNVRVPPPKIKGYEAPPVVLPPGGMSLTLVVEQFERSMIAQALERTGGNRTQAATLLGINRTTLVERLRRMGI